LVHVTWQSPEHSASHVETLVQAITLPGPAETAHVGASWQVKLQRSPQITPHEEALKQVMSQSFPQEDVQIGMSWQVELQALLQTSPHVLPMWSHSWVHPSPVQPRSQSLPFEHAQTWPGSHPSFVWQCGNVRRAKRATAADTVLVMVHNWWRATPEHGSRSTREVPLAPPFFR
jgi:hypothetical protein